MHGTHLANHALKEADCILAIGMRFDDRVVLNGFACDKTILHVDVAAEEINKNVRTHVGLVSTASDFLSHACAPEAERRVDEEDWVGTACGRNLTPPKARTKKRTFIDPVLAIETLAEQTYHTSIVVTDVGQHQIWTALHYGFVQPRQWISSGGLATMGFGLPAAIGAAFAHPDQDIILVCGDGGFLMTSQELKVVADHDLRIKIFLFNNGFLGMVRQWEDLPSHSDLHGSGHPRGSHYETCLGRNLLCEPDCVRDLSECTKRNRSPDFVLLPKAFGINASRVTKNNRLPQAMDTALRVPGAYVLEVMIDRMANVTPMVQLGKGMTDFVEFSEQE
jgi:acetolactate synthase-1/2/3 large subunit